MVDAWEEIGAKRPAETYEEALARSVVGRPAAALTEQEIAEQLVKQREKMKIHDARFRTDFVSLEEERLVSRALMKQLGFPVTHDEVPE